MLIPEEGAPQNGMDSDSLAEEIKGRRAPGATATLVFDEGLQNTARESGLLFEEGVMVAAESSSAEGKRMLSSRILLLQSSSRCFICPVLSCMYV